MRIVLAGNPNCGKTTIFNVLCGADQHVGNWPGVTVRQVMGRLKGKPDAEVVDLPGTYSLHPQSLDEQVTTNELTVGAADVIINVVEAASLARGLYLTMQLLRLGRPMVIALNMMDEASRRGIRIDAGAVSEMLRCPVIPMIARRSRGIDALIQALWQAKPVTALPEGQGQTACDKIARMLMTSGASQPSAAYAAECMLIGRDTANDTVNLSARIRQGIADIRNCLCASTGRSCDELLVSERYRTVDRIVASCIQQDRTSADRLSARLDRIMLQPVMGTALILAAMLGMLWLVFGPFGTGLSQLVAGGVQSAAGAVASLLARMGASAWLNDLITQGLIPGVGSVAAFLPPVLILMLCLSILEDSGVMARIVFLADGVFRRIGMSGRACIPLLLGLGCTVPAAMAVRTMPGEGERRQTTQLLPFVSCGAKLPVYVMIAQLCPELGWYAAPAMYLGGLTLCTAYALLSSGFSGGQAPSLLMELPPYRLPTLCSTLRGIRSHALAFLRRAGTLILLSSAAVWALTTFTMSLSQAQSMESSILGQIASLLVPLLQPLGFASMQTAAALLTGLLAKENIVSTLTVMGGTAGLFPDMAAALSFMTFVLLYTPCAAAMAAMSENLGGWKGAVRTAIRQGMIAWGCAWVVHGVATWLTSW